MTLTLEFQDQSLNNLIWGMEGLIDMEQKDVSLGLLLVSNFILIYMSIYDIEFQLYALCTCIYINLVTLCSMELIKVFQSFPRPSITVCLICWIHLTDRPAVNYDPGCNIMCLGMQACTEIGCLSC